MIPNLLTALLMRTAQWIAVKSIT